MTLDQLIVLDAIVKQGTFRGAAEYLNKSQSALSHMLKKLESELDISLLSREEYRPKLTPAGEVFYRHTVRILRNIQDLKSVAKSLNAQQEAEILVAVSGIYPLDPLLKIISDLTREFPATHIRLSSENMGGAIEKLLEGTIDVAITSLHDAPLDQLDVLPLSTVIMCPVAHPDFEPARNKKINTITEMQSYAQIVVADSSAKSAKRDRGVLPGGLRWTVSDFSTKKSILLSNMGWGGMPEHLIQAELANGTLVRLNVEGYPPTPVPHYLVRRRDKDVGIVGQALWKALGDNRQQED